MKRGEHQRGHAVLWILFSMALLATLMGSLEFYVDRKTPVAAMYWVFGVGLAICVTTFFVEARRDPYTAAGVWVLVGSIVATITGAVALLGVESHPVAAAVSILSAAGVAAALTYILKMQFGRDPLPNILRERFERPLIHEVDGVQLVVELPSPTTIAPADPQELRVYAQNGWSRERQFIIELRAARRLSLNSAGLIFPARSSITLAAGAAGLLSIPLWAEPTASGRHVLHAHALVLGEGGVRVRRWRAQAMGSRLPGWLRIIGAIAGYPELGEGIKLSFAVRGDPKRGALDPSAPPADATCLWSPTEEELSAALPRARGLGL